VSPKKTKIEKKVESTPSKKNLFPNKIMPDNFLEDIKCTPELIQHLKFETEKYRKNIFLELLNTEGVENTILNDRFVKDGVLLAKSVEDNFRIKRFDRHDPDEKKKCNDFSRLVFRLVSNENISHSTKEIAQQYYILDVLLMLLYKRKKIHHSSEDRLKEFARIFFQKQKMLPEDFFKKVNDKFSQHKKIKENPASEMYSKRLNIGEELKSEIQDELKSLLGDEFKNENEMIFFLLNIATPDIIEDLVNHKDRLLDIYNAFKEAYLREIAFLEDESEYLLHPEFSNQEQEEVENFDVEKHAQRVTDTFFMRILKNAIQEIIKDPGEEFTNENVSPRKYPF
jgi:hypothetical protein